MLFPVYEHFVISTFTCLRRWLTAIEIDPGDMSYWVQPPPAPDFIQVEPKKKKKGEKKPRFRTTTVPPNADFAVCAASFITVDLGMFLGLLQLLFRGTLTLFFLALILYRQGGVNGFAILRSRSQRLR